MPNPTQNRTNATFHHKNRHNSMKSLIYILAGFLFLEGCSPAHSTHQTPAAPSLPVIEIKQSTAFTTVEYPATIEGTADLEIRPQVGGYLDKIFVDEGSYVSKGHPLFKIDEKPFREALNQAQANLSGAEAALIQAELEVEKYRPLVANKVVSEFQLKAAVAAQQMAAANLEQAKALLGTAKINLGYTLVQASVSGYVGRLSKKQGTLVSPTDPLPLTTLSDVHEVRVYFALGETAFINFKNQFEGETLDEKIKNLPAVSMLLADHNAYSETGKVDMVDGQFNRNTGTITFRATFPNSNGLLRSGNTGRVQLSLPHENAILVPQEATIEIQDKVFVFTVDRDNKVAKQPIEIIGRTGQEYLVSQGLKPGDRIVFKGFETLQEGAIIEPQPTENYLTKK